MRLQTYRFALAMVALVLSAGLMVPSAQSGKVDVTGAWAFTVESAGGTGTPTVTFKQDGEKLTGHYSSMFFGEADLTGTLKGQAIEFLVAADVQGTKVELKFTGTVEGKDAMNGKTSAGELGDGTFTAKRK